MISIENIQYIEWALIIGFILGIVTIVVGYMDMKKKSKKIMKVGLPIQHIFQKHMIRYYWIVYIIVECQK